jgi:hypothetical protein
MNFIQATMIGLHVLVKSSLASNIWTGNLDSQNLVAPGCGPERPAPLHTEGAAGFTSAMDTGQAWDPSHSEPGKEAGSSTWGDETSRRDSALACLFGKVRPCQLLVQCLVQALWSSFSIRCEAYVRAHPQLHISVVPLAERLAHSSGHCVCGAPLSMCWTKNTVPCGFNFSERTSQKGTRARMGGIKWIFAFGLAFDLVQNYFEHVICFFGMPLPHLLCKSRDLASPPMVVLYIRLLLSMSKHEIWQCQTLPS